MKWLRVEGNFLVRVSTFHCAVHLFISAAEEERTSFMQLHTSIYGFLHHISRDDIYSSTLSLYKEAMETIISEYPFRMKFDGEAAVDSGGVSRDFFSGRKRMQKHLMATLGSLLLFTLELTWSLLGCLGPLFPMAI